MANIETTSASINHDFRSLHKTRLPKFDLKISIGSEVRLDRDQALTSCLKVLATQFVLKLFSKDL